MKKSETKEAAIKAVNHFVKTGKLERDTVEYSTVVYRDEQTVIVTFCSPTKRNPEQLTQRTYSLVGKFMHETKF